MEKQKVKKTKTNKVALTIFVISLVFLVLTIGRITYAYYTDFKNYNNNLQFGKIELNVTQDGLASGSETLQFNINRTNGTYTNGGKIFPNDEIEIDLTISLTQASGPAFYLMRLSDTQNIFETLYYFKDGNNVYVNNGEKTYLQSDTTKASVDKKVGKLASSRESHAFTIKARVSKDYTAQKSQTTICCNIFAVQQYNLTEVKAEEILKANLSSIVPTGFTEVEYLELTGSQYINTGVIPTIDTKTETIINTTTRYTMLLGSRTKVGATDSYFVYCDGDNGLWYQLAGSGTLETVSSYFNLKTKIATDNNYLYVNDKKVNSTAYNKTSLGTSTLPMYLGGLNQNGAVESRIFVGKIYSSKIYKGDNLIRNFVPCVRNSDDEPGFYDLVEGKFYTNANTTTSTKFKVGNYVLTAGYTQKEYIKASGEQYIKTDYIPSSKTKIDMDVMFSDLTKTQTLFCSRTTYQSNSFTLFYIGGVGYRMDWGNVLSPTGITATTDTKQIISFSKELLKVNDKTWTRSQGDFACTEPLLLFASSHSVDGSGDIFNYGTYKLYGFKIYEGNNIVMNLVPCEQSGGELGLYDIINKKFYGNSGTGSFIAN